jgi:hypothetical protein
LRQLGREFVDLGFEEKGDVPPPGGTTLRRWCGVDESEEEGEDEGEDGDDHHQTRRAKYKDGIEQLGR